MTSILYVDDDGQMLRLLTEMFGGEFDVRTTDDTDEALRLLDTVAGMLSELSSGIVQQFIPKPWDESTMREALTRA